MRCNIYYVKYNSFLQCWYIYLSVPFKCVILLRPRCKCRSVRGKEDWSNWEMLFPARTRCCKSGMFCKSMKINFGYHTLRGHGTQTHPLMTFVLTWKSMSLIAWSLQRLMSSVFSTGICLRIWWGTSGRELSAKLRYSVCPSPANTDSGKELYRRTMSLHALL